MKVKPGPNLLEGGSFIEKLQASQAVDPSICLPDGWSLGQVTGPPSWLYSVYRRSPPRSEILDQFSLVSFTSARHFDNGNGKDQGRRIAFK